MNQKTVIVVTSPELECFGSFRRFCKDKGLVYQTLQNKGKAPKIGEPVTIGQYTIQKVNTK